MLLCDRKIFDAKTFYSTEAEDRRILQESRSVFQYNYGPKNKCLNQ